MARGKRAPYLGKISFQWCNECDLPLLRGKKCPRCGQPLSKMHVAPPGDVRPAFKSDVEEIRDIIDQVFLTGCGDALIHGESLVLLNKIGGLDSDYQVFVGGEWIGNYKYDFFRGEWTFMPTYTGAMKIHEFYHESGKLGDDLPPAPQTIEYLPDAAKFVSSGKSVLAPGVTKLDKNVFPGDPAIVYSASGFLAICHYVVGKEEIESIMAAGRGQIAKNRESGQPVPRGKEGLINRGHPDLEAAIELNMPYIEENVALATSFIRKVVSEYGDLPVGVAYSGGKDSLVTLSLVLDTMVEKEFHVIFADTGLELPEVVKNVTEVIEWAGLAGRYHSRHRGEKFWELVESFGPPARDFRYCCHSLKASQINEIIDEISSIHDSNKVLVFLGQRRYESFTRASEKRVYTNSYIPRQLAATPIKDWTALDEWFYLLAKKKKDPALPLNPLYFVGHDRLGCYLCPAQSLGTFDRLKSSHPALHEKWSGFLESYRERRGLPLEWVQWGLWRFKKPRGQWKNLIDDAGINMDVSASMELGPPLPADIVLNVIKGASPCTSGGYSVKAAFSLPLDLELVEPWVRMVDLGFELDEESGSLHVQGRKLHGVIFSDGSVFMQSFNEGHDFDSTMEMIAGAVARALACQQCGVCVNVCPRDVLQRTQDGKIEIVSSNKCLGPECHACIIHCPVYQIARDNVIYPERKE